MDRIAGKKAYIYLILSNRDPGTDRTIEYTFVVLQRPFKLI